jgi:3-methyladenine DNA glycosylase Tag
VLSTKDIYGFRWKIIEAKRPNDLAFDFNFNLPEIISLYGPDKVIVEMIRNGFITSQEDKLKAVMFKPQEIILPRQLASKAEASATNIIKQAVSYSLKSVFFSNFATTAVFSIMMYYLWGMINGLQLIAMTCLFRIQLPANAFTVL